MCLVISQGRRCYPLEVEKAHPEIASFRNQQERYWKKACKAQIVKDILTRAEKRATPGRYVRFNESGDFWSQECVDKLSYIATELYRQAGIITYGFSARHDLDFSAAAFLLKGSGHELGNNGSCIVVSEKEKCPAGFVICPEDCTVCTLCMVKNNTNIAFIER